MSSCCAEARIALLETCDAAAFGELIALPAISDHYLSCPRAGVAARVAAISLWSGWDTDGIAYLAAWDARRRCIAGAHLTATSIGFFVHPAWRRRGLGTDLVSACAALASTLDLHTLRASTRAGNVAAQSLLLATGFSRTDDADRDAPLRQYRRVL